MVDAIKPDAEFDRDAKPGERITFADVVNFGMALEAVENFKQNNIARNYGLAEGVGEDGD